MEAVFEWMVSVPGAAAALWAIVGVLVFVEVPLALFWVWRRR